MRAFRVSSSSLSPSWKSMARLALPSRLELKRPEGSFREAPLAKVIFTTFLYVSPVQISPLCDQTGVPLHFHSSATSGSASLIRARSRESISPLQSPRSSILTSISSDGDSALFDRLFFMLPASPWVAFLPWLATPLSLVNRWLTLVWSPGGPSLETSSPPVDDRGPADCSGPSKDGPHDVPDILPSPSIVSRSTAAAPLPHDQSGGLVRHTPSSWPRKERWHFSRGPC